MLIIAEPPDALQDSLFSNLRKKLPKHVRIDGRTDGGTLFQRYAEPLYEHVPGGPTSVICSRWHLTQPGVAQSDPYAFRYLELFLASRGAVLVLPLPVSTALIRKRDDQYKRSLASQGVLTAAHANATSSLLERVTDSRVSMVFYRAAAEARRASRLAYHPSYIGTPAPGLLFVDTRSLQPGSVVTNSLHKAIPLQERSLGFFNALDGDTAWLWNLLERPAVVSVGERADYVLTQEGVPHSTVPELTDREYFTHEKHVHEAMRVARSIARPWRAK